MTAAHTAVLALGSNLGDREATIRAAVHEIGELPGVVLVAASGLVETPALKPEGVDTDAPAYLNAVVAVTTLLDPHELLEALHGIERHHGRVRDIQWGDRTLDLDIITFGRETINSPGLTVPHPRAADRDFVLAPWAQIDPDAELPGRGPIAQLITQAPTPYPAEPLL
ncbi:2-amino-4-hydroxy-6-hydroxymethyldihydropteridine diphosphokinase [Leifsonia sp. H3M29-4]|uniref:2-amino-4-hydroxy-6- hydroxymethyldihydropteridine diphosphokinase n=1 Tax=Salinibacterium metalliresistens TaxID=3031321 RepID=UPI0023D9EB59|nr:2-amino-4-hydroxy-6-hydroxymethyldihydropteridine diphosphokinase [Salinibacterium metalliresistens]MDF1477488.1 2-amino-4-hydroxy-6-hydroxymethyldihydropteridine diphosphokinase [Salinibacterium metalliresistens]